MKETFKNFIAKIDLIRMGSAFTILYVFVRITDALINHTIPEGNKEILHNLVGIVEGTVMTVITYEFGSSKNQGSKTDDTNTIKMTNDKEQQEKI